MMRSAIYATVCAYEFLNYNPRYAFMQPFAYRIPTQYLRGDEVTGAG